MFFFFYIFFISFVFRVPTLRPKIVSLLFEAESRQIETPRISHKISRTLCLTRTLTTQQKYRNTGIFILEDEESYFEPLNKLYLQPLMDFDGLKGLGVRCSSTDFVLNAFDWYTFVSNLYHSTVRDLMISFLFFTKKINK